MIAVVVFACGHIKGASASFTSPTPLLEGFQIETISTFAIRTAFRKQRNVCRLMKNRPPRKRALFIRP
jgi:hypothetical protein